MIGEGTSAIPSLESVLTTGEFPAVLAFGNLPQPQGITLEFTLYGTARQANNYVIRSTYPNRVATVYGARILKNSVMQGRDAYTYPSHIEGLEVIVKSTHIYRTVLYVVEAGSVKLVA